MCLALPARVLEHLPDEEALVAVGTLRQRISLAFVGEVPVGSYVIVHVGHAIGLLDPEEAEETLKLFEALQDTGQT